MITIEEMQEAKDLSLEVWRYTARHPKIQRKCDLPLKLYRKIEFLTCECPMCELFMAVVRGDCRFCALFNADKRCYSLGQPFDRWKFAPIDRVRKEAAEGVVKQLEAWDVKVAYLAYEHFITGGAK